MKYSGNTGMNEIQQFLAQLKNRSSDPEPLLPTAKPLAPLEEKRKKKLDKRLKVKHDPDNFGCIGVGGVGSKKKSKSKLYEPSVVTKYVSPSIATPDNEENSQACFLANFFKQTASNI